MGHQYTTDPAGESESRGDGTSWGKKLSAQPLVVGRHVVAVTDGNVWTCPREIAAGVGIGKDKKQRFYHVGTFVAVIIGSP